jgi:AraC family transcriptional regulator
MTVLPAGCGPPIRLTDPSDVVVYALDPNDLGTVISEIDGPTPTDLGFIGATHDRDLMELLRLLGREIAAGSPCGRLYSDALAFSLLARVLSLSRQPARPFFSISAALNPRHQRRVFEYVDANLHRNIGLQELADLVGYSRGHFLRMFRAATGATPHWYLTERRIERAKALLAEGRFELSDIAASCGFSSQSHLSTEFRRRTGISPARYRRKR